MATLSARWRACKWYMQERGMQNIWNEFNDIFSRAKGSNVAAITNIGDIDPTSATHVSQTPVALDGTNVFATRGHRFGDPGTNRQPIGTGAPAAPPSYPPAGTGGFNG